MKLELVDRNVPDYLMKPGQASVFNYIDENDVKKECLHMACPKCGKCGNTYDHTMIRSNGLITIEPSLLCIFCDYHYYVRNGEIVT